MTATRIVWSREMVLTVYLPLEEVQESFDQAWENDAWVAINGRDGQNVSVNPSQVLYLEEVKTGADSN
jgi:hypothetical protein